MSIDLWFPWFEWSLEDLQRLEAVTDRGETPLARAAARGHGAVVSGRMWELDGVGGLGMAGMERVKNQPQLIG